MATKEAKLQIVIDAQNRTQGTFNALQSNLDGVKKSYSGLQSSLTAVGAAGVASFAALGLLSKEVIKAGANFEQTQIAFDTMIGSAEEGQKTLRELSLFAARTPFELPQLETASKQLLAYGTTASELLPTLTMLGDISAGVGMDKLPQLILAFGQVKAATRLTGMELRQFSEAGVPLLGTLATQFGVTAAEMTDMISDGKVGFKDVEIAFQTLTAEGGRFHNLMAQQAVSLSGLWSTLKDNITLTARAVGTELLPYLKPVVEQLIEITKAVGAFAAEHPKLTAALLVGALAFTALLAVLLPIAVVLPGLIVMWGMLTAVTLGGLATFTLVIAILAALGFALMQIYKIVDVVANHWGEIWLGIELIAAESANAVMNTVESMINFVIAGVNTAIKAINKVIAAASKIPGVGKNLSSIKELSAVDLGSVDTDLIASKNLAGRSNPVAAPTNIVQMVGNTFLSQDVAEKIGDMMLGKLKLSSQL